MVGRGGQGSPHFQCLAGKQFLRASKNIKQPQRQPTRLRQSRAKSVLRSPGKLLLPGHTPASHAINPLLETASGPSLCSESGQRGRSSLWRLRRQQQREDIAPGGHAGLPLASRRLVPLLGGAAAPPCPYALPRRPSCPNGNRGGAGVQPGEARVGLTYLQRGRRRTVAGRRRGLAPPPQPRPWPTTACPCSLQTWRRAGGARRPQEASKGRASQTRRMAATFRTHAAASAQKR